MTHDIASRHRLLWLVLLAALLWLALIIFAPKPVAAAEKGPVPVYAPVPERSKLKFTALQNNLPVEGGFSAFTADIRFDPERLEESSITAEVDLKSLVTSYPEMTAQLLGADWFDVERYPTARMRTLTIYSMPSRDNDDRRYYYADAELSLRGKTAPITLNFILERYDGEVAVASGKASVQRLDHGVGQGEWAKTDTVEDIVAVSFRVLAERVRE